MSFTFSLTPPTPRNISPDPSKEQGRLIFDEDVSEWIIKDLTTHPDRIHLPASKEDTTVAKIYKEVSSRLFEEFTKRPLFALGKVLILHANNPAEDKEPSLQLLFFRTLFPLTTEIYQKLQNIQIAVGEIKGNFQPTYEDTLALFLLRRKVAIGDDSSIHLFHVVSRSYSHPSTPKLIKLFERHNLSFFFQLAVYKNCEKSVDFLIADGIRELLPENSLLASLQHCCKQGYVTIAKMLIEEFRFNIEFLAKNLLLSASSGKVKIVQMFRESKHWCSLFPFSYKALDAALTNKEITAFDLIARGFTPTAKLNHLLSTHTKRLKKVDTSTSACYPEKLGFDLVSASIRGNLFHLVTLCNDKRWQEIPIPFLNLSLLLAAVRGNSSIVEALSKNSRWPSIPASIRSHAAQLAFLNGHKEIKLLIQKRSRTEISPVSLSQKKQRLEKPL